MMRTFQDFARGLLVRRLLVALFAVALVAAAGCDDDDVEDGGDAGFDAGVTDAGGEDAGEDGGVTDAGGEDAGEDGGTAGGQSVTVTDQTLEDLSTLVTVDATTSEGPGWMVIHEDDGAGSPGPVIGFVDVPDGESTGVRVALDRPAEDGETLYAMLHEDLGTEGEYEFPGPDVPSEDADGNVVVAPFVVTVPADLPAVRLVLGAIGIVDWEVTAIEPTEYEGVVANLGPDPALTLDEGWRYEVENTVRATHPFALVTQGATFAEDTVLLSQAADGTLEDTASIGWVDLDDFVQFTVSTELAAELDGYRCEAHPADMRGDVTVAAP